LIEALFDPDGTTVDARSGSTNSANGYPTIESLEADELTVGMTVLLENARFNYQGVLRQDASGKYVTEPRYELREEYGPRELADGTLIKIWNRNAAGTADGYQYYPNDPGNPTLLLEVTYVDTSNLDEWGTMSIYVKIKDL
jgi:hypothetical protein